MKTECPHCHTLFRVNDQQLQHSGGQVRCGHCLAVFTAELPKQMSFDDLLDIDDAETSLASIEEPGSRDTGAMDVEDSTSVVDAETEISVLTPETDRPPEDDEKEFGHALPDVIPPALRAETRNGKKRFGFIGSLFWFLAICLMVAIGLAQYAWYDRMHLLQYPQARPWYELACSYLQCQLPEPRDPALIELSRKNIYTHPNNKLGLMVSGTMVNQAEFAQDFPLLELRFENIRGEAIAARRFAPDEYLDLPKDQIVKMQPGEPVAFTLEIIDPGPEVVSYEFTFL
jgi:predicted Zn finger-like uncharacterized protein